jgi:hypothetical protein
MAIAEKRFKFLSEETNLPSSTFGAGKLDDIINTASNELKEVAGSALNLIKSSTPAIPGDVASLYSSAKDALGNYTRDIKSVAGVLTNYKDAPEALVKNMVNLVSSGAEGNKSVSPATVKAAMDVLRRCGKGSSYGYGGRPYDVSANCNGGKASLGRYGQGQGCDSSSYGNLLNSLSGGGYQKGFSDINSALRSFMALSGYGYKLGLCGVFNSLYGSDLFSSLGMGNLEFGKAAGSLLGIVGKSGNTKAWIDIAKSSTNLFPKMSNPDSLSDLLGDFSIPENLKEVDQVALMEQLRGAQELYDPEWMKSELGTGISIAARDGITLDYQSMTESWLTNRALGEDSLDSLPSVDDDDSFYSAAIVSKDVINDALENTFW